MSTISSIVCDFNPRSPDGERPAYRMRFEVHPNDFNPRSPDGERPSSSSLVPVLWDFNPRSPDGERLADPLARLAFRGISIHAPRMGSDRGQRRHRPHRPDFNPRSPDGERPRAPRCSTRTSRYFNPRSPDGERRLRHRNTMVTEKFQSTLPGWGATRGESNPVQSCRISIHAPRMGSDASVCRRWFDSWHFNPRSPDGERLEFLPCFDSRVLISIHAPRMGSDTRRSARRPKGCHFNPRSPDGERPGPCHPAACSSRYFNPRSPDGERRHGPPPHRRLPRHFNPRSPDGERPADKSAWYLAKAYFNPRSPDGERPVAVAGDGPLERFQSTLPGWGATRHPDGGGACRFYFNPRSPDGERPAGQLRWCAGGYISIHAPRVFCQIFVGRFGVSFSPFERLFLGRFGFGQSCGLSVIA